MTKVATLTEMVESTVSEILKDVGTSIPGHVLEFDEDSQSAKIQVGVERINRDGKTFVLEPIVNVHVHFPGGDYCVEYEINKGNEGVILVCQRCIDGWKEQGGVAGQPILRKLDIQDALFIPGIRSKPNALSSFANDGIRLRNKDASEYVWLKSSGIEIKTGGDVDIISTALKHNGVNIGDTHTHSGVTSGGQASGPPV
jgi:hypothetical protein